MTQYLPPNLLALFAPRDPIPYLPPVQKLPFEKKTKGYAGLSQYIQNFEVRWWVYKVNVNTNGSMYFEQDPSETPLPTRVETREERLERKVHIFWKFFLIFQFW